eukprot:563747-Alexandrium_andersonii.AAC.1
MDGTAAGAAAVRALLPHARIHRDLQHVKKDFVSQSGRWHDKEFARWINSFVMFTAAFPSSSEFSAAWFHVLR